MDAPQDRMSSARSASSNSSRKSAHTDSASNSSARYKESCTSSRQLGSAENSNRLSHGPPTNLIQRQTSLEPLPPSTSCSQSSVMHQAGCTGAPQPQLGVMHQLTEHLEKRRLILQHDIKTQQQELHHIKEKLQLTNLQMFLQQPVDFPHQASALNNQSSVMHYNNTQHPKSPHCTPNATSLHTPHREQPSSSTTQQGLGQMQGVCVPVQTHTSPTMPLYSNPMMFQGYRNIPDTHTHQMHHTHHIDNGPDGQLRMLLNQPVQNLMPDNRETSTSHCSSTIQQSKYLDQQMMTPSFPVQQLSCNAVLVPSPVFTSPIVISHNSFITPQAPPTYTPLHQNNQQGLHIQHQQFFQMQPQGLIQSGSAQAFFHTGNIQPQSTVGYLQHQQTRHPQQQHLHSQSSASSLSDYRNILPR